MSVELKEKQDGSIPVSQMRDGQIGVISQWKENVYIGDIIMRFGDVLIHIGEGRSKSFPSITLEKHCRVKILENGTELIIKDNE